jgi:hypothetical protein
MNLSTELLIGIILIVIGLLLGAAAYMVLSSRKNDQLDEEEDQDEKLEGELEDEIEEELPEFSEVEENETDGDIITGPEESEEAEPEELPIPDQPELGDAPEDEDNDPEVAKDERTEPESLSESESPEPEPFKPEPKPGPRIQVAMLLRDEVSGELIVQVGDREYRSADELRDSGDWTRVEFAASDLTKWIDQPVERPALERDMDAVDRSKPLSMIEQINDILQEKIEASGESHLAVRLIEGTEGTARVLVGVHSYELGEVPDESISDLIREAVADWEAAS